MYKIIIKEGGGFAMQKIRHEFHELALKGKANLKAKTQREEKLAIDF